MSNMIKDTLVIILGLTMLLIFIPILLLGSYSIIEPNPIILAVELLLSAVILGLGIYFLIKDARGG